MANLTQARQWFHIGRKKNNGHPVKVSALWALKEALMQERYEDCREIIAIAKEFGAGEQEIYYLLEDPRRKP